MTDSRNLTEKREMNRDTIKYIAMITMLLNHVSFIFLEQGTVLAEILTAVGYFTAPVMCYFLVEGMTYTRSPKKYGQRLLLFAVISELPYCLAMTGEGIIGFAGMDMLFTLFLCFLIIKAMREIINPLSRNLALAGLILLSLFCDWAVLAPAFTILFVNAGRDHRKLKRAFLTGTLVFGAFNFLGGFGRFSMDINILCTILSMAGPATAGICILRFYNGKRAETHRNFSKWFFYWFYPVHLLILGLVRVLLFV